MPKNNKKNKKKKSPPTQSNITDLEKSRDGGQIALRGYSYQFLYSCSLILSSLDKNTTFTLEGIEDIDKITQKNQEKFVTHIQLKYSTIKQDASFMGSVLKNYLEAYLIDSNRCFKLVYDFDVAKGNLSNLFSNNLDIPTKKFWQEKIEKIKKETSNWNWNNFVFDDFISKLSFENIKKEFLEKNIEDALIKNFEINIDNIVLYANGLKLFCIDKMESRGEISYTDIYSCVESIKFDISKGSNNPAHSWIQRIKFSKLDEYSSNYYEGKKATPADIANGLPIERPSIEKEIADSIHNNTITVIKTSSGQGKTTLALRTIFALKEEYTPYQITWCNNVSELNKIVEFFRMRTRIGEKPIILIDNLDANLSEWNMLAQLMQTSVTYHYKLIVTSRENDWYNYSGDISNLHSLKIIKPTLTESEAIAIFNSLKKLGKLHNDIIDWKNPWLKIAERQLLIEYIYILTHGEMIAERISAQMKKIGNATMGGIKFEILRKVCFADVCGIKLETKALINSLVAKTDTDIGEILKSLANEFLVHVSANGNYIEGLHPVRSRHIVECLHEYIALDETALSVAKIANFSDLSMLFSHYSEFDFDKKTFYSKVVSMWWNLSDFSQYIQILPGAFSGSIMQYYKKNKKSFDAIYEHSGLPLVAADISPFTKFEENEQGINALDKLLEIQPQNTNLQYLVQMRNSIPKFKTANTDIFCLCSVLYEKLKKIEFSEIIDIESYSVIVHWLYNIDATMNLTPYIELNVLWNNVEKYSIKSVSSLMYSCYCGNKDNYNAFVNENLTRILSYLKHKTHSHIIDVINDNCIKVDYILRASQITKGNNESVSRLTDICRTLPIYDLYCSDAIKPEISLIEAYQIPNDAHKEMPKINLVKMFNQNFNSLWLKTIESNYEFETVNDWIEHWLNVRKCVCELLKASSECLYKLLAEKKLGSSGTLFDGLNQQYNNMITAPLSYPREHRPFVENPDIPELFSKAKSGFFDGIQNFANQLVNLINREKKFENLAIYNLTTALDALKRVQQFFDTIALDNRHQNIHNELCAKEEGLMLETYMCCKYYICHKPNQRFSKYQVRGWFLTSQKHEIDEMNNMLVDLNASYNVVFPKQVYLEKTLSCYPILLKSFDITNETEITNFLIKVSPFAKGSYDYLVLIIASEEGEALQSAIKFPKRLLQSVHDEVVLGKEVEPNELLSPYPIDVEEKMLECFDCNIVLQKQENKNLWLGRVGDIGEELWVYSKNRELLISKDDEAYLHNNLEFIKSKITDIIQEISEKASFDVICSISTLCEEVYSGKNFGNTELNVFLEMIKDKELEHII